MSNGTKRSWEQFLWPRQGKKQTLWTAFFLTAFFCLGLTALVEGPQQETQPKEPVQLGYTWLKALPPTQEDFSHAKGESNRFAYGEIAHYKQEPRAFLTGPLTDANGHPLKNAAYVRTVYQAFPLADMPG